MPDDVDLAAELEGIAELEAMIRRARAELEGGGLSLAQRQKLAITIADAGLEALGLARGLVERLAASGEERDQAESEGPPEWGDDA